MSEMPGAGRKTEVMRPDEVAAILNKEIDPVDDSLSQARASEGVFVLPAGYIDDEGVLHREIQIREMTGQEEDLLGAGSGDFAARMNQIMAACVVRIGTIEDRPRILTVIRKLPIADRTFLFTALRRVSLGDEYEMEVECPKCNKVSQMALDLGAMEIKEMPEPDRRVYEVQLPSGKEASWHIMTGEEEEVLSTLRDASNMKDVLSYAIMMRLEKYDGKELLIGSRLVDARGRVSLDKDGRSFLKLVKSMSIKDRNFLRAQFGEKEAGMDTDIEFECPECQAKFVGAFDPTQIGFFFPSGI
jgi:phage FluMu protein Com